MKKPLKVLITAGPTHEPIDAVRYLGNRSSGRMGFAIAKAALARNIPVTLLLGPVQTPVFEHSQISVLRFQTTSDLQALMSEEWPNHDILIMAAAVSDYRPCNPIPKGKLKRDDSEMILKLESTPDLVAEISRTKRPDQTVIAFALEQEDRLQASALEKMLRKGVDGIVANPLDTMGSEKVSAMLLLADGTQTSPNSGNEPVDKEIFADWLVDTLLDHAQSVQNSGVSPEK